MNENMIGRYKQFAERFIPNRIIYLLIGESPPFTQRKEALRYFYNYENTRGGQILLSSVAYTFLNQKFYIRNCNKETFLKLLQNNGIFLLDATYEPINQIKSKNTRLDIIKSAYTQLKEIIGNIPLDKTTKVFLIHNNVIRAIGDNLRRDFRELDYQFYNIGFPRYYNDETFRDKINAATKARHGTR
jgi:hypothetical protein